MKNNPMCYIDVKEGNIESLKKRRQNEGKYKKLYTTLYTSYRGYKKNYPTTLTTEMDYSN